MASSRPSADTQQKKFLILSREGAMYYLFDRRLTDTRSKPMKCNYSFKKEIKPKGSNYTYPMHIPCGKCKACRVNRILQWTGRCILEAKYHSHACMVTLTFNDEGLEKHGLDARKDEITKWMKRFRKHVSEFTETKVRYILVSEYGKSSTRRLHYHAIIFGMKFDFYSKLEQGPWKTALDKSWPYGYTHAAPVNSVGAYAYVLKYLFKQLLGEVQEYDEDNHPKKEPWLIGRKNTIFMQSRNPGIGMSDQAVDDILDAYVKYGIFDDDIPAIKNYQINPLSNVIRLNNRIFPVSPVLMNKLLKRAEERKLFTLTGIIGKYAHYYTEMEKEQWEKRKTDEVRATRWLQRRGML